MGTPMIAVHLDPSLLIVKVGGWHFGLFCDGERMSIDWTGRQHHTGFESRWNRIYSAQDAARGGATGGGE